MPLVSNFLNQEADTFAVFQLRLGALIDISHLVISPPCSQQPCERPFVEQNSERHIC